MINWDLYELSSENHSLHGVMCRGRIRKYALQNDMDLLTENANDVDGVVRVAVLAGTDVSQLEKFLREMFDDAKLSLVRNDLKNPVLSKLKVNLESRYEI